jgi:hypothetical protein
MIPTRKSRQGVPRRLAVALRYLDVDFVVPPRVSMKFVRLKANEKEELPRDTDDLEINCK